MVGIFHMTPKVLYIFLREFPQKWECCSEKCKLIMKDAEKPPIKTINHAQIKTVINELAQFLTKNDTNALTSFESLKGMIPNPQFGATLVEMEKFIDNFNFDLAMPYLQEIATALNIPLNQDS